MPSIASPAWNHDPNGLTGQPVKAMRSHRLACISVLVAMLALARPSLSGVDDISWLIDVAERVLAGQQLHIDLLEPNPPASVWLYLPAVWLARLLGLKAEGVVDGQVLLVTGGSLGLSAVLLAGTFHRRASASWLLLGAALVLLVLPHGIFGQREHFVLLLLLPALTLIARARTSVPLPLWLTVCTGLAAGAGLAIKPVYAPTLALACLGMCLQWGPDRPKLWPYARALLPAGLGCLVVLGIYLMLIVWLVPQFLTHMLPLLQDVYLPARLGLLELFSRPLFLLSVTGIVAGGVISRGRPSSPALAMGMASLGAMLAYLLQGKGFQDHAFPMLALALIFCMLVVEALPGLQRWLAALVVLAFGTIAWNNLAVQWDTKNLAAEVARIHPAPRLMTISHSLLLGHPLVRQINGTWVSRLPSLWIHNLANVIRQRNGPDAARDRHLAELEWAERTTLLGDLRDAKPDIVLVQVEGINWLAWAQADPEISQELLAYRSEATIGGVQILHRHPPP